MAKLTPANTCDGAGKPPTIVWREVPAGIAVETVLVVEDPDAKDGAFIHWTQYGMSAAANAGLAPERPVPDRHPQRQELRGQGGLDTALPARG